MNQPNNQGFELAEAIVLLGFAKSKSEARRLIKQGAIRLGLARPARDEQNVKVSDPKTDEKL